MQQKKKKKKGKKEEHQSGSRQIGSESVESFGAPVSVLALAEATVGERLPEALRSSGGHKGVLL